MIFGSEYKLIGIICTPEYDHYNTVIVGLLKKIKKLQAGKDYYNDGRKENSKITAIDILSDCIINNNPYVALYTKINP